MKMPLPDGRTVEAVEMEVADVTERWTTILLANGQTIRTKNTVIRVLAIPGEKDQEGNQRYMVQSMPVIVVQTEAPRAEVPQ